MYSFIAYIFKHYMVSVFPCFKIFLEHVSLQKAVIYFLYDWTLRLLSFLLIFVMNFLILNLHTWLFPWKRFLGLESSQRVWVFSPLDCQQDLSFLLRGISFFRLSSPFIYFIATDSSVFPCFQHQWLGWSALPLTTVTLEAAACLWCCVCTPWGAPITSTQPASPPPSRTLRLAGGTFEFCACWGHSDYGLLFTETSLTHLCSVSALLWPQTWIFLTPCLISSPYDPMTYFCFATDPQVGKLLLSAFPLPWSWLISHSISPFFFCISSKATSPCFSSATNFFALHGILSFDLFKKYFGHTAGHVESYFLNHG